MIKINLLPKKLAKKMILYDLYLFLLVVILNLSIVGGIYYKNEKNIAEYKKMIGDAKAEIASLENIYREYLNLEKEKQEIEKRIKAINDVKEGRALAARTLYDLTSVIKENVWLKSFKKDEENTKMFAIFLAQIIREGLSFNLRADDIAWEIELTGGF